MRRTRIPTLTAALGIAAVVDATAATAATAVPPAARSTPSPVRARGRLPRRRGRRRGRELVTHDEPETGAGVDPERDATNFAFVQSGDVADALTVSTKAKNDLRF